MNSTKKSLIIVPAYDENDYRFPTFQIDGIDEQLNKISKDNLIEDYKKSLETFPIFFEKFDLLFNMENPLSIPIRDNFKKNGLNLSTLRINYLFLNRKIEIFFTVLNNKNIRKTEDNEFLNIMKDFIDKNSSTIYVNDIEEIKLYFNNQIEKENKVFELINSKGNNYSPSITYLNVLIKFILQLLIEIISLLENIINKKKLKEIENNILSKFYNYLYVLESINEVFENFYLISNQSLWDYPRNSEKWNKINKHFKRILLYSRNDIIQRIKNIEDMVNLMYASESKGREDNDNIILQKASSSLYLFYYFFNQEKANAQSNKYFLYAKDEISKNIWKKLDSTSLKAAVKFILPSIEYREKWYVKKIRKEKSLSDLNEILKNIENNNLDNFKSKDSYIGFQIKKADEPFPQNEKYINDLLKEKCSKDEKKNYIKLLLLNNKKIKNPIRNKFREFFEKIGKEEKKEKKEIISNKLIFHVHGGGFVTGSPQIHEPYTRKFSIELGVPVFSIRYSLSPKYPFPKALDDIYQAYIWIITYSEEIFGIQPKNILFIGDSSGGNLILSLTCLLIAKNIQIPNSLFLIYPALKLNINDLCLSYLNCFTDKVLEYKFLRYCIDSYSDNGKNCNNPFLSPLYMNDKILKKLPIIRIFNGSSDPLRDDSLLFCSKLIELGVDVEMREIKYFPHCFINYDHPKLMPEVSIVMDIIIKEMKNVLEQS